MKKILIAAALVCSILGACSNNANEHGHEHEDGSTHDDHTEVAPSTKQEEFKVDSAATDTSAHIPVN